MNEGRILTYGKKAVTIQNKQKNQFYAPINEVEDLIIPFLRYPLHPIYVTYDIDYNNYSGEANGIKRYYAYNVKIIDSIIV